MATVTIDQMKDQLLTLDEVYNRLGEIEPFQLDRLDSDTSVSFDIHEDWSEDYSTKDTDDELNAFVTINGQEKQLTVAGLAGLAKPFGLTMHYARKIPHQIMQGLLDYHYREASDNLDLQAFSVRDKVLDIGKGTLTPFSTLAILDAVTEKVYEVYGDNVEILADYKFQNSLGATDIRLIVPEAASVMRGTNMHDVPQGESDEWSLGVHIGNSLTGGRQTSVEPYMFRWWCTNGATETLDGVGSWNRRVSGQQVEDVCSWAATVVEETLNGMSERFSRIQRLNGVKLKEGNTAEVLQEIYQAYRVPVSQRNTVAENLLASNELNMYTLMYAITSAANDPTLNPKRVDELLRLGGGIPSMTFDTKSARVFREGQQAGEGAENPYEVGA